MNYFTKFFLKVFVISLIFFSSALYIVQNLRYKQELNSIIDEAQTNLSLLNSTVVSDFEKINSHIFLLRDYFELTTKENSDKKLLGYISEYFRILSSNTGIYDQVRYLDQTGQEIVRINYDKENGAYIVSPGKLQNKKNRYYFSEGIKTSRESIYYSPLDLNIENNVIEKPLDEMTPDSTVWRKTTQGYVKPMIRIAASTRNQSNEASGLIVLNYFGQNLMNHYDDLESRTRIPLMMLDANGYWLKSPRAEMEWGFMYDNSKDNNIQNYYPEEWAQINTNQEGYIQTDNGIFIYNTFKLPKTDGHYYKNVFFIDQARLNSILDIYLKDSLLFGVLIVFISFISAWFYAAIAQKRKLAEDNLKINNIQLDKNNQELQIAKNKLEKLLNNKTTINKDLEESMKEIAKNQEELQHMNSLMVGRELQMIKLKAEIEKLKKQNKQPAT